MVNWSELGAVAPGALEPARLLAHHGVQWVSRAARANLKRVAVDVIQDSQIS
jgi:hypothetical protein